MKQHGIGSLLFGIIMGVAAGVWVNRILTMYIGDDRCVRSYLQITY